MVPLGPSLTPPELISKSLLVLQLKRYLLVSALDLFLVSAFCLIAVSRGLWRWLPVVVSAWSSSSLKEMLQGCQVKLFSSAGAKNVITLFHRWGKKVKVASFEGNHDENHPLFAVHD